MRNGLKVSYVTVSGEIQTYLRVKRLVREWGNRSNVTVSHGMGLVQALRVVHERRGPALGCGVWGVVFGVWCSGCGVWCVVCGVWCVVCGVWCVVCGVWCVVCGVGLGVGGLGCGF